MLLMHNDSYVLMNRFTICNYRVYVNIIVMKQTLREPDGERRREGLIDQDRVSESMQYRVYIYPLQYVDIMYFPWAKGSTLYQQTAERIEWDTHQVLGTNGGYRDSYKDTEAN